MQSLKRIYFGKYVILKANLFKLFYFHVDMQVDGDSILRQLIT